MNIQKVARIVVTLQVPRRVHEAIAHAKSVVAAVAANPGYFPSPMPSLASISADIAALEAAEALALTKVIGAVEARDAKMRTVIDHLLHLTSYVQVTANADPPNALAIATAATLTVKKLGARTKQDLTVKPGTTSGVVLLYAKSAGPRAAYDWQWSLDDKAWTDLPNTMQAHTHMVTVSIGATHYFRFRSLTKSGKSDWSQVVGAIVK